MLGTISIGYNVEDYLCQAKDKHNTGYCDKLLLVKEKGKEQKSLARNARKARKAKCEIES